MSGLKISDLVGSSQYKAIADDALKDEDNAAWVMGLEPNIQQEWIERITWIRFVDRLAENELVDVTSSEFHRFCAEWQSLVRTRTIQPHFEYADTLSSLHDRWLKEQANPINQRELQAWNQFLAASIRYHQPNLVIPTLNAYATMLQSLSGSCFQLLPFLHLRHWTLAYSFGALDQFFNNLRDLREDAEQGICYIPTEILAAFGVHREDIVQLQAGQNPNFQNMMKFWLDKYLPTLQHRTTDLLTETNLHPSWVIWRDWSFHRYRRIERVFRDCNFDYTQFPQQYWAEVQQDLPLLLAKLKDQSPTDSTATLRGHCLRTDSTFFANAIAPWDCQTERQGRGRSKFAVSSPT